MVQLSNLRPQPDSRLAFLQGFLKRPQQVGSVIPSSRFLERRIVTLARAERCCTVVELGPGTGGTTRGLLQALPRDARLLAVEVNPRFGAILGAIPDERLQVHTGSAEQLPEILALHGLPGLDAVVSGIPFSTIPEAVGRRILEAVWRCLSPGGSFVAYQVRERVRELAEPICGRPRVEWEPRNIPPVRLCSSRAYAEPGVPIPFLQQ